MDNQYDRLPDGRIRPPEDTSALEGEGLPAPAKPEHSDAADSASRLSQLDAEADALLEPAKSHIDRLMDCIGAYANNWKAANQPLIQPGALGAQDALVRCVNDICAYNPCENHIKALACFKEWRSWVKDLFPLTASDEDLICAFVEPILAFIKSCKDEEPYMERSRQDMKKFTQHMY